MATTEDILSAIDADRGPALERLFDFLRIPSISAVPAHFPDCERAADWLTAELADLGFEAEKHPTEGRPMVVGHMKAARPDVPHVLFYGHYDVQPVDPLDLWRNPPFEPKLEAGPRGERIVARGASDDKGQLMTFLEACRAFKKFGGPPCDVTALFEGEEETGSPSLPAFLARNAKTLKADIALVCDTGMWGPSTPAITTALRGLVNQEVILRGASRDLHSGLYGGAAVNPIHALSRILADLHDDNGSVAISGFYDGVEELPEEIRAQWSELGFDATAFLGDVGLTTPAGERDRTPLEQLWSRPTCDVNGVVGGYTGEGTKTVLPAAGQRQGLVPAGREAEPRTDRRVVPVVRDLPPAPGRESRIHQPRRESRHIIADPERGVAPGAPGARGRMGEACGAGRLRRVHPDCRLLQARTRHGQPARRVRARGRQHPLAQREIRARIVP